jgi:hypothetical protein
LPYAIVNVEHNFARHAQVRPNDRRYPFARNDQVLTWRQETTEELQALFRELYRAGTRGGDDLRASGAARSACGAAPPLTKQVWQA